MVARGYSCEKMAGVKVMKTAGLIRDEKGQWWVTNSRNKPIIEFAYSDEAEYAYQLGIKKGHEEPQDAVSAVLKSKPKL